MYLQINLEELSLVELRAIAKEKGIKNIQKFRKHELMDLVKDAGDATDETASVEETEVIEVQKPVVSPAENADDGKGTEAAPKAAESPAIV